MGYSTAVELAGLERGLEYHLAYNHYPPVPLEMVDPCKAAIEAYNDQDYHREIDLPAPITWRGKSAAPASALVEAHHLDAFIDSEDL